MLLHLIHANELDRSLGGFARFRLDGAFSVSAILDGRDVVRTVPVSAAGLVAVDDAERWSHNREVD